jgi:hypothetical protein
MKKSPEGGPQKKIPAEVVLRIAEMRVVANLPLQTISERGKSPAEARLITVQAIGSNR